MAVSQEDILKTFGDMSSEDKAALLASMVSNMSVMDVVKSVEDMEEKFGVSAASAVAVAAAPGAAGAEGGAAEQIEFTVMLTSFGDNKVAVIKAVRAVTGLGLKEAKETVEKAPVALKEGVAKEEADDILKQLQEAGATGELK